MQFKSFDLPGPIEIAPTKFVDDRGYFAEIFRRDAFVDALGEVDFVQENQSLSKQVGTVRGLHFQTDPFAQGKLVRCVAGEIFDVAVDIRHDSPTFGQWVSTMLSADAGNQFWIPPGFAHGFCTLQPDTVVCYKVTAYYSAANDKGIAWDDRDLAIAWPADVDHSTLSAKDRVQPALRDLPTTFRLGVD